MKGADTAMGCRAEAALPRAKSYKLSRISAARSMRS